MKFDFENGLPVWVWGIAFLLIVLPFFARPNSQTPQYGPNIVVDGEPPAVEVQAQPTSPPTPTIPPDATVPIIIELAPAPAPSEGYPEPEEPQIEILGSGYD